MNQCISLVIYGETTLLKTQSRRRGVDGDGGERRRGVDGDGGEWRREVDGEADNFSHTVVPKQPSSLT